MAITMDNSQLVEFLVERVDLVDLIEKFTTLKVFGNTAKGLCPIHKEKTASLNITISKKLFICFGCKASGNVINFVQHYYKYNFSQAVDWLAREYELDLKPFKQTTASRAVSAKCNDIIWGSLAKTDYFAKRGISEEIVEAFKLRKSFAASTLYTLDANKSVLPVCIDNARMWDNTYVYPLINYAGEIYGFKSRKVDDTKEWCMTSNQSAYFSEQKFTPYGFHIARPFLKDNPLILVEGNHDVLKMHTHEFKNVCGLNSSSFSEGHLVYLTEFKVHDLIIMLDNDEAGINGMIKIATSNLYSGINVKFARVYDCKDPDEFLDKHGRQKMQEILNNAMSAQEYLITMALGQSQWSVIDTGLHDKIQKLGQHIMHDDIIALAYLSKYVDIKLAEALLYAGNPNTNLQYEELIIRHLINATKDEINEMLSGLKMEYFVSPECKDAYSIIMKLAEDYNKDKFISEIQLANMQYLNKYLLQVHGILYETIKEKFIESATKYSIAKYLKNASERVYKSSDKVPVIVANLYDQLNSVININNTTIEAKDVVDAVLDSIFKKSNGENNIIQLGTGFEKINKCLKGIANGNLITIAANQSVGKTTLLCNWLQSIIRMNHAWLHFSLEMSNGQILSKIIGIDAHVESEKLQDGTLSKEDMTKVMESAKFFYKSKLLLNDECNSISEILNTTLRYIKSHNIAGMSVDYVQLIQDPDKRGKKRYEELGIISGELKNFARKNNIPIIILSQLSKEALKADVARAEHGSEAYKIAQDSDQYITLKAMDDDLMNLGGRVGGNLVLNIDKNRFGKTGLFTLYFNKDFQKFHEIGM